MAVPQPVLVPPSRAALFLVVTVHPGAEAAVRDALQDVTGLTRSVAFRGPADGLTCVAGIGSEGGDRPVGDPRPRDLHPFPVLRGPRHRAPATPGDLLFHLRARRADLCFEPARLVLDRLGASESVVDEVHGFGSFDERDLLGLVDGGEFGTHFIGHARTPAVTERMLRNMFLGDPPGNTDRVLDFARAVTGGLFFMPSADLPGAPDAAAPGESPGTGRLKGARAP
ncbi:Dyp-type peroxidase [Streptomyces sp. NPDC057325]|uniref:Dyp-type peroxidase n=1 Tax=unclassified Streptomyces TaxID=2593676 RepID=UPI00362F6664